MPVVMVVWGAAVSVPVLVHDQHRTGCWVRSMMGGLTPWVGHAESQDVPGGSEMIHPYGKEKLP